MARREKKTIPSKISENKEKMKELVLFISEKSMADAEFGATKLNKLLFYSDFLAYLNLGHPITGMEYMRLDHGPAPRRMLPIEEELWNEGALQIVERKFHGHTQRRPIALRPPNLKLFSPEEISLVEDVIRALRGKTAHDVSELSHKFVGWQVAEEKEVIPYSVARIEVREPTAKESAIAKKLLKKVKARVS